MENITLSNGKVVEFKNSWTRKMDREFNTILLNGVKPSSNPEEIQSQLSFDQIQNGEEYVIIHLTNLTQKEIDDLEIKDYNIVKEKVTILYNELKIGSK